VPSGIARFQAWRSRPGVSSKGNGHWLVPAFQERFRGAERYLANQNARPFGDAEMLNNTLYQLMFLNNLQALLRYADRSSMAFSVEARLPFLDYRLVEFALSLPSRFKIRDGYTKRVLRDGMKGLLPEAIRWRVTKLGFATPERSWQKGVLSTLTREAVDSGSLAGMVDPTAALAHLERIASSPSLDSTPWRWTSVHLWKKAFAVS
jgi:asparagine synthase (glutamine-hydrolysing)